MGIPLRSQSLPEPVQVKIKRRLTADEVLGQQLGEDWRSVFRHPLLKGFVSYTEQDTTGEHLSRLIPVAKGARLGADTLNDMIYLLTLCSDMWRALGVSPLSDPEYNRLQRHIYSGPILHKIDNFQVPLVYRQIVLWDLPELAKRYKRKGIMPLPAPPVVPAPAKRKLRRLPKHGRKPAMTS